MCWSLRCIRLLELLEGCREKGNGTMLVERGCERIQEGAFVQFTKLLLAMGSSESPSVLWWGICGLSSCPSFLCSSILLLPKRRQLLLIQALLSGTVEKNEGWEGCFSRYSSLCLFLEELTGQGVGGHACVPPPECWNLPCSAGQLSLERQGLVKKWTWVCCLQSNLSCTLTRAEMLGGWVGAGPVVADKIPWL